jgi:hypothetical protein
VIFFDLAICSEKKVKTLWTESQLAEWIPSPPNFLKRITALGVIISNIGYPNFFHITFQAYLKIPKGNLSEGDN